MKPLQGSGTTAAVAKDYIASMVAHKQPQQPASAVVYRDHSHHTDDDKELNELLTKADAEGVKGTDQTFPVKLHQLLSGSDEDGFAHVVNWQPHGRSFIVKKHKEFVEEVLPCCFRQTKFASFQRQLNLYGFRRITTGRDKGGYYHELFLRGRSLLALKMQRTKVKGTGARKPSQPETEPDFYDMPLVHETTVKNPTSTASRVFASPAVSSSMPAAASPSYAPLQAPLRSSYISKFSPSPPLSCKPTIDDSLASSALLGMSMGKRKAQVPERLSNASRREIIDQMLTNSARMQQGLARASMAGNNDSSLSALVQCNASFRRNNGSSNFGLDHLPLSYNHSLLASSQRGPLHLNALNMPCACAIPAF